MRARTDENRDGRHVRVTALQVELAIDAPSANMELIRASLADVVSGGAVDLVVLAEVFDGRYESTDGAEIRSFLSDLAREFGTGIVGGSCFVNTDGRDTNTCFVFDRSGAEVGRYDKRILFSSESSSRVSGAGSGVFEVDGVRVGVLICADTWHPELSRELAGRVDVLAIPTKTSVPSESFTDYAHANWTAMAMTRAMENGLAVVVADWPLKKHEYERGDGISRSRHTHFSCGATCIIDPSGRPDLSKLRQTVSQNDAGVLRATIDLDALQAYRSYRAGVGLLPASLAAEASSVG